MGSRQDHKGVLILGSGKWATAKAQPAAGDVTLGPESINNWEWGWGRDGKICVLKAMSAAV